MRLNFTAALTALALGVACLAPPAALARDHRGGGYYGGGHHGGRGYHNRGWHDHGDEALAAGVVGLVLGLAIGAAASSPPPPRRAYCYDNYRRCDGYAPQAYAPPPPPRQRSAYEDDYGSDDTPPSANDEYMPRSGCIQRAQQWDPYSGRYVEVNVRVPC